MINAHTRTRLAAIGIATLLLLSTVAVPVAAQSSDGGAIDDLFNGDDEGTDGPPSFVGDIVDFATNPSNFAGAAAGLQDRLSYQASRNVPWADADAVDLDRERNATIETVNANSDILAAYIGNQTSLSETQVHAVRLADEPDDAHSTFYLTLTYNTTTESFERVEATIDQPANTTIDHEHRAEGQLAENLSDETETFITEYAAKDTNPMSDGQYVSRMASQYGSDIQSTLLHDDYDGFGGDS